MARSTAIDSCPSCTAKLAPGSQFCPQCGTQVLDGETLEINLAPVQRGPVPTAALRDSPPTIHHVHRRPMGVHPLPLLGGFGAVGLVAAIVLIASGSLAAGLILLGLAVAASALFLGGAGREPDAPAAMPVLRARSRVRSWSRLAGVGVRAFGRAALEVMRIRLRQIRLRRELKAGLAPLGQAVYEEDDARAQALKRRAAEAERELSRLEHEASAAIGTARAQLAREHTTFEPTQRLPRA